MTFDIDSKPESPRLQLFGRVGAYCCLTSEFSWKRLFMQNDGPVVLDFYAEHLFNGGLVIEESPMLNADPLSLSGLLSSPSASKTISFAIADSLILKDEAQT